jgi:hypothetical protein
VTMVTISTSRPMMTIKPLVSVSPRTTLSISRPRIPPCPLPCLIREHP